MTLVECALANLVLSLREHASTPPTIQGVLVDDDSVEVLLAKPSPPPQPWTATAEGFRWRISAGSVPDQQPGESAFLPALASAGRVSTGSADALINLEAVGLVSVTGDRTRATAFLYAMAAQLIGAPWTQAVNVILAGLPPGLATADNVRSVTSVGEVANELRATAEIMAATVRQNVFRDVFEGRIHAAAGDGWPPVVLISALPVSTGELEWLADVTHPGKGVAAVVLDAGVAASCEVDVSATPTVISPLRLGIEPTILDARVVAALEELILAAGDVTGALLADPPYDGLEISVERPATATSQDTTGPNPPEPRPNTPATTNDSDITTPNLTDDPATTGDTDPTAHRSATATASAIPSSALETNAPASVRTFTAPAHGGAPSNSLAADPTEPPSSNGAARVRTPSNGNTRHAIAVPDLGNPAIVVRVLGSVEVEGASEFKRAKARELLVYLAMHPNGVGESELDEALWGSNGSRVVAPSTRDSTVSVARTAVGGAARLLPAQGQGREKRYQLGPDVQSDWSQFCALHRFGRDNRSPAALHEALALVRGRPFEGVVSGRTYGWIHTEGHGRHIEAEVADAADFAAALSLSAGDPLAARWAARRGLLAEPYTERLWVRLMEAADALGESQEIERIMDEMDVVLELEGDFTSLHPNTLAVYDRLSRRHRLPAER
jgi:DNA-binding SARP family transcriptional activator